MKKILLLCIGIIFSCHLLVGQSSKIIYEYKDQVGYLSPDNPDYSEGFERCSEAMPVGFYSSTHPKIYNGSKAEFKAYITTGFNKNKFTEDGLLNLRFLINCKGEIGDVEVNELDFNFEKKEFPNEMVKKLKDLSFKKHNWNYQLMEKQLDYYMYLIFRIENGKVVEILP